MGYMTMDIANCNVINSDIRKNLLITGASSGIGNAMLDYFVSLDYTVIAVSKNRNKLESVTSKYGEKVKAIACDLSDLREIRNIFDFVRKEDILLDGIIHCAGVTYNSPLKTIDIEDMESQFRLNTESLVEICRYASSKKYTRDASSIVAISSTASYTGSKGLAVYAATKASVNSLVKTFSHELIARGIRINAIAPSMVDTPMYEQSKEEIPNLEESLKVSQPLGIINPKYLAYLAEFLISEKAKFITGAIIPVGAGNTIW